MEYVTSNTHLKILCVLGLICLVWCVIMVFFLLILIRLSLLGICEFGAQFSEGLRI